MVYLLDIKPAHHVHSLRYPKPPEPARTEPRCCNWIRAFFFIIKLAPEKLKKREIDTFFFYPKFLSSSSYSNFHFIPTYENTRAYGKTQTDVETDSVKRFANIV